MSGCQTTPIPLNSGVRCGRPRASTTGRGTLGALIDDYFAWEGFGLLGEGTRYHYKRSLEIARKAWGALALDGLQPVHVQRVIDGFAKTPAKANLFLSTMRALVAWARPRGKLGHSITEGVKPYPITGGHKPWTPEQVAAVQDLDGVVRRGIMLYLYTGQRGSDIVRLGWTDIDDGGFAIKQRKTGREVWCPIGAELAAEMESWRRAPGPFVRQVNGSPYDRKLFWKHFTEAAAYIPALADVTLHGLRATAVVRLRREGLTTLQISDIVGMSPPMIERYCRFADKKESGKAALISLTERAGNKIAKQLQNCKTPPEQKQ